MPELRHVKFGSAFFTDLGEQKRDFVEKKKLQTISSVELSGALMSWGFLESIPNIKKLGIYFDESGVVDLSHLRKLKTLKFESGRINGDHYNCLRNLRFPWGITRLTLVDCLIFKRDFKTLCALLGLESLKLSRCSFAKKARDADEEWEVEEGNVFSSLQFLCFEKLDLVHWRADETNFPKLRGLSVWKCPELEEIPGAIGEIMTLQSILIGGCSDSTVESAKQIQEKLAENGDYSLKLHIKE